MHRLCAAIEGTTDATVRQDGLALWHRGANLRYAVERAAYIALMNHEGLFRAFIDARAGRDVRGTFESPLLADVARRVCEFAPGDPRFAVRQTFMRALRRRVGGWVRRLRGASHAATQRVSHEAVSRPVLFAVGSGRFVRYLEPVVRQLAEPFAFVADREAGLRETIQSRGWDCCGLARGDGTRRPEADDPWLENIFSLYERIESTLKRVRPRVVVLVEGNAPQDELWNRACRAQDVPTVCVQQGWSPIVHTGFRNMSYTRMCVWGEGFAELLAAHNPEQTFVAAGHHLLEGCDNSCVAQTKRNQVAFFLQAPGRLVSPAGWDALLRVIERTAESLPETTLVVREHPTHPLSAEQHARLSSHPNVQFSSSRGVPLADVLRSSLVSVSLCSSTTVESIACGVVPIVLTLGTVPMYYPDVSGAGAGVACADVDSAVAQIARLVGDAAYRASFTGPMRAFREEYFASLGDAAASRIAAEIVAQGERFASSHALRDANREPLVTGAAA